MHIQLLLTLLLVVFCWDVTVELQSQPYLLFSLFALHLVWISVSGTNAVEKRIRAGG